jgi:hypothetical protein
MEKGVIYTNNNSGEGLIFVQVEKDCLLFLDKDMNLKRIPHNEFDSRDYKTIPCNKELEKVVDFVIQQISVGKYIEEEIEKLTGYNKTLDSELSDNQYNSQLESIEVGGTYRKRFDNAIMSQNFVVITNIWERHVTFVEFNSEFVREFGYDIECFKFEYEKCDIKVNEKLLALAKNLICPEKNDELEKLIQEYNFKVYKKDIIQNYINNVWPKP